MTPVLSQLGYTPREAQFLKIAALSGGYFLRSHFNEFSQRRSGAIAQQFLVRGLSLGHIEALPAYGSRIVYHVNSAAVYSHLGDPSNRNRRSHGISAVQHRLRALDCVLRRPAAQWLYTQQDRRYYLRWKGLVETAAAAAGSQTFAPHSPVELLTNDEVRITFVDDETLGLSGWQLFLKAHRLLLQRLPGSELVFAGVSLSRQKGAERLFSRLVSGESGIGTMDLPRLRHYFTLRRQLEERTIERITQAVLDQLREERRVFAAERFESMYREWIFDPDSLHSDTSIRRIQLSFEMLPRRYEWLRPQIIR